VGTVNVFSGQYARRAFEAALDVVANNVVANDDGVSIHRAIHRATTPVYTVVYKKSINLFIPHLSCVRVVTATAANAYRIDATLSLLRFVATSATSATSGDEVATSATSGDKVSRMAIADFSECRMAITGGLEMPEGQLEVAAADVIRARRSRTAAEKRIARHHAKAAAIIRAYTARQLRNRDPAIRAARRLKEQDPEYRARRRAHDRSRRYHPDPEIRSAYLAKKAQWARAHRQRSTHARAYARAYGQQYR
jgi:hypothetical protein